jgi:hypothetical protein
MARSAAGERDTALEVHLPEEIGRILLEALIRLTWSATGQSDATMTPQDRMHR